MLIGVDGLLERSRRCLASLYPRQGTARLLLGSVAAAAVGMVASVMQ
jgi:hypothetical protein